MKKLINYFLKSNAWRQPYIFYTDADRQTFLSTFSAITKSDGLFAKREMMKRMLNSGLEIYDGNGKAITLDENTLRLALHGVADAINESIGNSLKNMDIIAATQLLANYRIQAVGTVGAGKVSSDPVAASKDVDFSKEFYDLGLKAIMEFYANWAGEDLPSLAYALSADTAWFNSHKEIPFFLALLKYLESTRSKTLVENVDVDKAKKFLKDLAVTTRTGKKNSTEIRKKVKDLILKDISEKSIIPILEDVFKRLGLAIPQGLKSGNIGNIMHSGAMALQGYGSAIRADTMTDAPIVLGVHTATGAWFVKGVIGFNEKWYLNETHVPKKKATSRNVADIIILSDAPLTRIVDEISGPSKHQKTIFINAYASDYKIFLPLVEEVEKSIIVSGLMGSNAKISGTGLTDVTQFIVINGKFYSVVDVFYDIIQQLDWKTKVSISYRNLSQYLDAVRDFIGENAYVPYAFARSREAYLKFRSIKIGHAKLKSRDVRPKF